MPPLYCDEIDGSLLLDQNNYAFYRDENKAGQGAFGYSGPHLQNKVTPEVCQSDSMKFKKLLQTELFRA